jgi:hypothetical protein
MLDVAKTIEEAVALHERRVSMRFPVSIEVEMMEEGGLLVTFHATDISRTGAFLRLRDSGVLLPGLGSKLKLLLKWPVDTPTPPVNINAEVVRLESDGVGVKFLY